MSMLQEARSTLVELVESQLTEVIRDASVVQRHTKRTRLAPPSDDKIEKNRNPTNSVHSRRLLEAQDINLALQWRGSDKLFVTGVGAPFAASGGPSGDSDIETPLHNRDPRRRVIDLREYIASENTVQPPGEIGMKLHWLAVDGVQPAIPDNPTKNPEAGGQPDNINSSASLAHEALAAVDAPGNASGETESAIQAKKLLPYLLSEELRLYFLRVTMTLEAVKTAGTTPAAETMKSNGAEDNNKDDVKAKQMGGGDVLLTEKQKTLHKQTETVLHHIGIDSGLQELVPFLIQFVVKQLYECMNPAQSGKPGTIWYCRTLVRFMRQMLSNSHLHVELHVSTHKSVVSVLVACILLTCHFFSRY
jgi:transcription initiation factor TFIID subunit 6